MKTNYLTLPLIAIGFIEILRLNDQNNKLKNERDTLASICKQNINDKIRYINEKMKK